MVALLGPVRVRQVVPAARGGRVSHPARRGDLARESSWSPGPDGWCHRSVAGWASSSRTTRSGRTCRCSTRWRTRCAVAACGGRRLGRRRPTSWIGCGSVLWPSASRPNCPAASSNARIGPGDRGHARPLPVRRADRAPGRPPANRLPGRTGHPAPRSGGRCDLCHPRRRGGARPGRPGRPAGAGEIVQIGSPGAGLRGAGERAGRAADRPGVGAFLSGGAAARTTGLGSIRRRTCRPASSTSGFAEPTPTTRSTPRTGGSCCAPPGSPSIGRAIRSAGPCCGPGRSIRQRLPTDGSSSRWGHHRRPPRPRTRPLAPHSASLPHSVAPALHSASGPPLRGTCCYPAVRPTRGPCATPRQDRHFAVPAALPRPRPAPSGQFR